MIATYKLKRKEIENRYRKEIDKFYALLESKREIDNALRFKLYTLSDLRGENELAPRYIGIRHKAGSNQAGYV